MCQNIVMSKHKNLPGRGYRKGISLMELFEMFPDEESARLWFEAQIWSHGPVCPQCGAQDRVAEVPNHNPMPYHCGDCRKYFSVRIGTVLEQSKVSLRKWAIAIYLEATSLKGVASMKLHRDLKVTQKTAWFMLHRIRESWAHDRSEMFDGPVEADETFFGGKMKNMSLKKRKAMRDMWSANKTMVIGVLNRPDKKITARVAPGFGVRKIQDTVRANVKPGSVLYTDEAPSYKHLHEFQHESVKHTDFEYVRGSVHTNSIESFWATMKRAYVGTFHHLSAKHLWRYVNEFVGRYNIRDEDTIDQMKSIAKGLPGRRLTYRGLVGPTEV